MFRSSQKLHGGHADGVWLVWEKDTLSSDFAQSVLSCVGLPCDKGGPGEATKLEDHGAGGQLSLALETLSSFIRVTKPGK